MKTPIQQIANYAGEEAAKAHFFGGFLDDDQTTVLFFSNRGNASQCKALEVLRRWLSSNGFVENAFACCDEDYSWALIASGDEECEFEPHSVITNAMQESGLYPAAVAFQSAIAICKESENVLNFARSVYFGEPSEVVSA